MQLSAIWTPTPDDASRAPRHVASTTQQEGRPGQPEAAFGVPFRRAHARAAPCARALPFMCMSHRNSRPSTRSLLARAILPMKPAERISYGVLLSVCACHAINDMIQSLLSAIYPTLKADFNLTFGQIGASDARVSAHGVPACSLSSGSRRTGRAPALFAACGHALHARRIDRPRDRSELRGSGRRRVCPRDGLVGVPSGVVARRHTCCDRTAGPRAVALPGRRKRRLDARTPRGCVRGPALGPRERQRIRRQLALLSTAILSGIGLWYRRHLALARRSSGAEPRTQTSMLSNGRIARTLGVLLLLIFSRFAYAAGFANYYTFYLMHHFGVSPPSAQLHLSLFLASGRLWSARWPVGRSPTASDEMASSGFRFSEY